MRDVFHFNPTCEMAVANGTASYTPPIHLLEFEKELSILPFIFADSGDFVITEKAPSKQHIESLCECGFELPAFADLEGLKNTEKQFRSIQPWGWSLAAHHQLKDLKRNCSREFKESPVFQWKTDHKKLFDRRTAHDFLINYMNSFHLNFLCNKNVAGIEFRDLRSIEEHLLVGSEYVFKAPYSSSGRGIQMIRRHELNKSNKQWIKSILNQQGAIIIEPLLNKVIDFSFHFEVKKSSEIIYHGLTFFQTNSNGQYKGTYINPDWTVLFSEELELMAEIIHIVPAQLTKILKDSLYCRSYEGFIGIDAMLYHENGKVLLQPCIEINCRRNMGILSFFIEKHINESARGKFEVFFDKDGSYNDFVGFMKKKYPLRKVNNQIFSGFLSLTEPDKKRNQKTGAFILLDR